MTSDIPAIVKINDTDSFSENNPLIKKKVLIVDDNSFNL